MLGWRIADSEEKRKPFNSSFVSLGVMVDYTKAESGTLILRNKPGRVKAIQEQIARIIDSGTCSFQEALSVKGKLAFAEGQIYGRMAAPVNRILSIWASNGGRRVCSPELLEALNWIVSHLENAGPRVIGPPSDVAPVLIFTDGAVEDEVSIGGVIFCPGETVQAFGAVISQETVNLWKTKEDQRQVICQAELFPLIVARLTWGKLLEGRRVLLHR